MTSYVRDSLKQGYDSLLPSIHRGENLRRSGVNFNGIGTDDPLLVAPEHQNGIYGEYNPRFPINNGIAETKNTTNESLFYPRSHSPTMNRKLHEMQDQIKMYREDVIKKDKLISQLSSVGRNSMTASKNFMENQYDDMYSNEKTSALLQAKTELSSLQIKLESLQTQVRESQAQLENREDKIRSLKIENETLREQEAKVNALNVNLRQKIAHIENQTGTLEGAASRGEIAIQSLQKETHEYQNRVLELEARIRTHLEEREKAEQEKNLSEKRYVDLLQHCSSLFKLEDTLSSSTRGVENITQKITEMVQENAMLKGRLVTIKDSYNSSELEMKANRETIQRLVAEAEREKKSASKYTFDMENLRIERDNASAKSRDLERELESARERLESTQRAWTEARRQLEQHERRLAGVDTELRGAEFQARNADDQYRALKEQLAGMLSDGQVRVEPYEESIRERLRQLVLSIRDRDQHIKILEGRTSTLNNQIESKFSYDYNHEKTIKALEAELGDLREVLRRREGDLATEEVMRENLRRDKERYLLFMERVSKALKMDNLSFDLGLDMVTDAIVQRCEQAVRQEADGLADSRTHVHSLQRKVRSQKEQLDSKELHMDLLRKKVASLEEKILGKGEIERDREGELMKNRKLLKLAEKYKREVEGARHELRDAKARLLETSEYKNRTLEQEREIENLSATVDELEKVRVKQVNKISTLRDEVDHTIADVSEKKAMTNNTIQALSSELRTTKNALNESSKREKQLLELRQVVARMLGLDVHTLAVPDYEIIARLEKLILANSSSCAALGAVDARLLSDMSAGFRAGYEQQQQQASLGASGAARRRTGGTRPTSGTALNLRTRSRSMSPTRRRDTRAY